jgi:RNA polymerase sigma factor (sigma-70 family)
MSQAQLLTQSIDTLQPASPVAKQPCSETATLIRDSMRRVRAVARSYCGRGVDIDDLIAAGNLGLAEAFIRFDPLRNVKLSTYAECWIRKRIREALVDQAGPVRLPRYQRDKLRDVYAARTRGRMDTGQDPDLDRVARDSGLTRAEVDRLLQFTAGSVSLDQPNSAGSDPRPIGDLLPDEETECPQGALVRRDLAKFLRHNLSSLDSRERQVVSLRYGLDGRQALTLREVGREVGISREGVRQVEVRALNKLKQRLHSATQA